VSTNVGARNRTVHPDLVLAVVVTVQLMIVLDNTVVNLALPSIRASLDFSATGLAWVSNAYILVFGSLLLLGGRLGDMFGRRRVFVWSLALFTLASLVGGAAPSSAVLIGARSLQGVGAAGMAPSALAILVATFAEGNARNRALGLFFAMSAAGGAVGLLVGGGLVSALSWRWVLWINVPFGIVVLALAPLVLAETAHRPHRIDGYGTITSTLGIAALVYGLIRAGGDAWTDLVTITALVVAAAALSAFVAIERGVPEPLLPLRLFASTVTASAYTAMLLVPAVMVGMYFFTAQFLQTVLGYSAVATGFAFLPMSVLLFAGSRTTPKLLAGFGPRPLIIVGSALQGIAMVLLSTASEDSTYLSALVVPIALFGIAGALLYAPLGSVVLSGVLPEDSGAASGAMQAVQQIGAALGIAALVSVFGTAAGHHSVIDSETFAHALTLVYLAGAAIAVVTLLLVLVAVRPAKVNV
jgi:EmrB/QacA subfamily drug resistance transporter